MGDTQVAADQDRIWLVLLWTTTNEEEEMTTKLILALALLALCCSAPAVALIIYDHPVWGGIAGVLGGVAFGGCVLFGVLLVEEEMK